jgi:hypothetical protein
MKEDVKGKYSPYQERGGNFEVRDIQPYSLSLHPLDLHAKWNKRMHDAPGQSRQVATGIQNIVEIFKSEAGVLSTTVLFETL